MFEWKRRVEILRAQNALRDGRLDEALAIAAEKDLRGWRACQVILDRLVEPLLARAARHLAEGRLEDAAGDVERARTAGGNRPEVAELRSRVEKALAERRRERTIREDLVRSARRRLAEGSVEGGKVLLEEVEPGDPEAARLFREAHRREEKAREACARAELLLKEGALLEALAAAREALASAPRLEAIPGLLSALRAAVHPALERSIVEGSLASAEELLGEHPGHGGGEHRDAQAGGGARSGPPGRPPPRGRPARRGGGRPGARGGALPGSGLGRGGR